MAAKLAVNVVLPGPNGDPVALLAGDEVPGWAKDEIGAHCLEQGAETGDDEADAEESGDGEGPQPPAKAGPGSSRDAWAAYAEASGVTIDDDADRGDIIAACDAAGVPTE